VTVEHAQWSADSCPTSAAKRKDVANRSLPAHAQRDHVAVAGTRTIALGYA
jgi:hypothetical protein